MYIDTHCHLSNDDYEDINDIIINNRNNSVECIIISGCTKKSILESLELSCFYPDVFLTIGYHPSEVSSISQYDLELLEKQLLSSNKIVGIGEIGLDYHYGKDDMDLQKELFCKQLDIALKYNFPVVIHSRDATEDTIKILKKYPSLKGVIHCFSGSIETANIYISMGFKLGIGGVVTFKNSNLSSVVKKIGINNIVLETDSPYLTPVPFRGELNSSKYIPYIAKKISDILDLDVDVVAEITTQNARSLFDLK